MKNANYENTIKALNDRGVEIDDMAVIVQDIQIKYHPDLTLDECRENIRRVLDKREVQNSVHTGIALDVLAEKKLLPEPLQSIIERDEPLYGIDEILAFGIVNVYGSIGFTNYGWIDKEKPGIVGELDTKKEGVCHTFLDDIVGAICASACSRVAHKRGEVGS